MSCRRVANAASVASKRSKSVPTAFLTRFPPRLRRHNLSGAAKINRRWCHLVRLVRLDRRVGRTGATRGRQRSRPRASGWRLLARPHDVVAYVHSAALACRHATRVSSVNQAMGRHLARRTCSGCALRRIQRARTPAARTGYPATALASRRRRCPMTDRCWIRRRCLHYRLNRRDPTCSDRRRRRRCAVQQTRISAAARPTWTA